MCVRLSHFFDDSLLIVERILLNDAILHFLDGFQHDFDFFQILLRFHLSVKSMRIDC